MDILRDGILVSDVDMNTALELQSEASFRDVKSNCDYVQLSSHKQPPSQTLQHLINQPLVT